MAGRRIVAIGARRDVLRRAGRRADRIDCHGATILPGLVDPHLHLFGLAARGAHLDCAAFHDVDALLRAVAAHAAALPSDAWVRGDGVDEASLDRLPTQDELGRAGHGRPVRLRHRSRHASWLNRTALARMPAAVRAVAARGGDASGLVAGCEAAIGRVVGPLAVAEIDAGLARAGRTLAAYGVTTIADATPRGPRALAPIRRALASGRLPQRIVAMRPWNGRPWRARGALRPGPAKILVEETADGLVPDPRTLAARIAVAAGRGGQVAVHCVGASTLVAALDAFERLPVRLRAGRRHRLEHVAECPPPFVDRIAALGLVVVTNPAFVYWRGDVYRAETPLGPRAWLYRARTLLAAGVALAAASDAPVVSPNPWIGVAAARDRRTRGGRVLGGAERLDAANALALFTRAAAAALGDDRRGRLAAGAPADLVAVEPDPLRASPSEVRATDVRLTIVGGRVAWPA